MADWDPFEDDDKPQAGKREESFEVPGTDGRHIALRAMEKCAEHVWNKMNAESPWQRMPDPKPDLSWHSPTCTLEDWPHTDVKCELGEGIVYFTLNRPGEGNKLVGGMMAALVDAVVLLHRRRDLRMAVFSGEGALLCSGGDPRGEAGGFLGGSSPEERAALERMGQRALQHGAFPDGQVSLPRLLEARLWQALVTAPQFTVCIANGSAMSNGLGLVACCDYGVALEGSFFSLGDVQYGLVPASVTPYIVAKMGNGSSKRFFCTCENLSAERARAEGLVDEVVPSVEEAHGLVRGLCEQLTACGPRSVEAAKELVMGVAGQQIIEPLMFYTSFMAQRTLGSDEAHEARQAALGAAPRSWELAPIRPLR